ncbi:MAG: iron chaperone, partial [Anaerolineales bacterium]
MPKKMKKQTKKSSKNVGFSDFEKAAMKDRIRELKAEEKMATNRAAGEKAVLDRIASMPEPDRSLAKRFHQIVTATAPELMPKTWYGMPAYANPDGKVVCFFQDAKKFESRYSTVGFSDLSKLDEG